MARAILESLSIEKDGVGGWTFENWTLGWRDSVETVVYSSKILQKAMMWMQFSIKLDDWELLKVLWRILINLQAQEALLELVDYSRGETEPSAPQQPVAVVHNIVFWTNGFTKTHKDQLTQSIRNSECPKDLELADRRSSVNFNLIRRDQNGLLRLADGTCMVAHFNNSNTVNDIRSFIDASRPGGARNYQLRLMGFPPKLLTNS
ncbi:UBX DOMAIN CONTAINING PROTEIN [Salix viminalis]|uniref:UBX DOMAIN CONTAINING PROTEIN n=1 Tax=Salix viminalis TaxID=40686 RepID=A0A9Q0TAA0_SALVM|nr:UBX DOMAIN CONTAINING PROTEIN [Salix viminalis]